MSTLVGVCSSPVPGLPPRPGCGARQPLALLCLQNKLLRSTRISPSPGVAPVRHPPTAVSPGAESQPWAACGAPQPGMCLLWLVSPGHAGQRPGLGVRELPSAVWPFHRPPRSGEQGGWFPRGVGPLSKAWLQRGTGQDQPVQAVDAVGSRGAWVGAMDGDGTPATPWGTSAARTRDPVLLMSCVHTDLCWPRALSPVCFPEAVLALALGLGVGEGGPLRQVGCGSLPSGHGRLCPGAVLKGLGPQEDPTSQRPAPPAAWAAGLVPRLLFPSWPASALRLPVLLVRGTSCWFGGRLLRGGGSKQQDQTPAEPRWFWKSPAQPAVVLAPLCLRTLHGTA